MKKSFNRHKKGPKELLFLVPLTLFCFVAIAGNTIGARISDPPSARQDRPSGNVAINEYRPALAVRASICITCLAGILLNEPQVHSRYRGRFKGVVIAESALFRLGGSSFEFDPVL
jgi:hypothetical protein